MIAMPVRLRYFPAESKLAAKKHPTFAVQSRHNTFTYPLTPTYLLHPALQNPRRTLLGSAYVSFDWPQLRGVL